MVTAVAVGFVFRPVISVGINRGPALNPMLPTQVLGTRYTIMADFLIVSALIVGADHALRSRAHDRRRQGAGLKSVTAVTALVVFLGVTWAVDFRYTGLRTTTAWSWAPIAAKWERDCAHSRTGEITEIGLYQALDAPLPEYHPVAGWWFIIPCLPPQQARGGHGLPVACQSLAVSPMSSARQPWPRPSGACRSCGHG